MTNQRYYNNNNIHTRLFYSLYFVLLTISVSVQKQQGHETIGNTLLEGSSSSSGTAVAFIIQPQFSSPVHRHHLHNNYCTITSTSTCTSSTNTKHKRNVFVCQYSNSDSNSNSDNDEKKERNKNDQSDNEETNFNNAKNNDKDNSVQMNAKKDNKNNSITNNSTLSQSPQPISSILYEDEECFDLCDVFEEDGNAGSSDEDNIEINELNKSQNSIPQPTSTASTSDKTTTASTSTAMSSTPPTSSSSSSSSSETKEYNKDPKPTKQVWQNLELRWSIDENNEDCDLEDISSCSEPCLNCRGTGVVLCQFCDGHGYVDFGFAEPGTMGKRLLGNDNPNGRLGAECPVCNEDGEQGCPTCRGSGWIARWRLGNNSISDLRP